MTLGWGKGHSRFAAIVLAITLARPAHAQQQTVCAPVAVPAGGFACRQQKQATGKRLAIVGGAIAGTALVVYANQKRS